MADADASAAANMVPQMDPESHLARATIDPGAALEDPEFARLPSGRPQGRPGSPLKAPWDRLGNPLRHQRAHQEPVETRNR